MLARHLRTGDTSVYDLGGFSRKERKKRNCSPRRRLALSDQAEIG